MTKGLHVCCYRRATFVSFCFIKRMVLFARYCCLTIVYYFLFFCLLLQVKDSRHKLSVTRLKAQVETLHKEKGELQLEVPFFCSRIVLVVCIAFCLRRVFMGYRSIALSKRDWMRWRQPHQLSSSSSSNHSLRCPVVHHHSLASLRPRLHPRTHPLRRLDSR